MCALGGECRAERLLDPVVASAMEDEAMQACMRVAEDIYLSSAIPRDEIRVLHGDSLT